MKRKAIEIKIEKFRREQIEAQQFAYELLMPKECVLNAHKNGMGVNDLAEYFQVTTKIMRKRLENLGII